MPGSFTGLRSRLESDRNLLKALRASKSATAAVPYALLAEGSTRAPDSTVTKAHAGIVPFGSLQQEIRPAFVKPGIKLASFGDHPDYRHLRGTRAHEFGAVTTMFVDVANSTRLGLIHPLTNVYLLKNAVLCAAIEIVTAFDGHVHRLMGDAVLAFFGQRDSAPEQGAIDAINCATTLRYYMDAVVLPALEETGVEEKLGVRIGLEHGPAEKVLWSAYGYPGNEEVTATSFHVDVASKLQRAAGRNQIMLGQEIVRLLDFPSELRTTKQEKVDGKEVPVRFVRPNHTLADGSPVNHEMSLLSWEAYRDTTPIGAYIAKQNGPGASITVTVTVHSAKDGSAEREYAGSAYPIPKGKWLRFVVRNTGPWLKDMEVCFEVENHGREAQQASENLDNHTTVAQFTAQHATAVQWEHVAYRGLHYMTVRVRNKQSRSVHYTERIGVYVE